MKKTNTQALTTLTPARKPLKIQSQEKTISHYENYIKSLIAKKLANLTPTEKAIVVNYAIKKQNKADELLKVAKNKRFEIKEKCKAKKAERSITTPKTTNSEYVQTQIDTNNKKLETIEKNYKMAIEAFECKKAFNLKAKKEDLENEINEYFDIININRQSEPLYKIASIITYYSLKTLANGRKIIDKEGKTKYTPSNKIALKILSGENSSCNFEDLLQDVIVTILEKLSEETIVLDLDTLKIDGESESRKEIFNTVQNKLRAMQEKHTKHLYNINYEVNENGEMVENDKEMYTLAQRAYDLSADNLECDDIISRLKANLSKDEKEVLKALLATKQVLIKNGSSNGGKKIENYKTRKLTIDEKAKITGYSVQTFKTMTKNIKKQAEKYLLENNLEDCKSYVEKVVLNNSK